MQIKIVGDRDPIKTKITDLETGEEITGVTSAEFAVRVDELPKIELTFFAERCEFIGHLGKQTEDEVLALAERIKADRIRRGIV